MNQITTFALLGILSALPCLAQANQTDSQTLQAILTEVRALHNEVRLSETTQLLLTELGIQQTASDRATQRRDEFRSKLSQAQINEKNLAARLTHFPEIPDPTKNPAEQKDETDMREAIKSELANQKSQEMELSNNLQEAESSLRKEQGTLDTIQGQLNDLVKKLQPAGSR